MTLSQPVGGATLGTISSATVLITNKSNPNFSTFVVVNTSDSGPGSLRAAITAANIDPSPGTYNIVFDIPASTAPDLNVPVPGFDPSTRHGRSRSTVPLPVITHAVSIDGYTQANVPVPYRYPDQVSSAVQELFVEGVPTGGTFTLTTSAPLPVGIDSADSLQRHSRSKSRARWSSILGNGNVAVTANSADSLNIAFEGRLAAESIPEPAGDQRPHRRDEPERH